MPHRAEGCMATKVPKNRDDFVDLYPTNIETNGRWDPAKLDHSKSKLHSKAVKNHRKIKIFNQKKTVSWFFFGKNSEKNCESLHFPFGAI